MHFTARQRRLLAKLLAYQQHPPSIGRLLFRLVLLLSGWSVIFALLVLATSSEQRQQVLMWGIGVLTGFLGSGLASIRLFRSNWPVYNAVIDWSKVKELSSEVNRQGV
jgi:hypothetical protein